MAALHWEARRKQMTMNRSNNIQFKWSENQQIEKNKQAKNEHQGFPNIPNLKDILPKKISDERKIVSIHDEKQYFRNQHLEKYKAKLPNRFNSLTYGQQW